MKSLGLLFAGLIVTLIAQFPLEGWADESDLGHWVQHGLIFWSGLTAGWACVLLYRKGQRRL